MSSLVIETSNYQLTSELLKTVLFEITQKLQNRVQNAYVFGSASTGEFSKDSDIDLILVVSPTTIPFVQRGFEFADLFEIYPNLDLLVYTQAELDNQLADSDLGFWKSVRLSMRKIV